jgi:hypothetical protein
MCLDGAAAQPDHIRRTGDEQLDERIVRYLRIDRSRYKWRPLSTEGLLRYS